MKSNINCFFKLLNNEFRKLLQKVRSFAESILIKLQKLRIGLEVSERVGVRSSLGGHVVSLSKTHLL